MTERNAWAAVRPLLAAGAMAVLSGCAATHVGEDWQCPIAQGSVCASVAAADPAVPGEAPRPGAETPLYRAPGGSSAPEAAAAGGDAPGAGETEATSEAPCDTGCGPLAWLRGLLAGRAGETGNDGPSASGPADEAADGAPAAPDMEPGAASPLPTRRTEADTAQAAKEAEPVSVSGTDDVGPSDGDLRAPEVIGRVWIAPFVDADGIYREGSWVRVVLAPAAWRLP